MVWRGHGSGGGALQGKCRIDAPAARRARLRSGEAGTGLRASTAIVVVMAWDSENELLVGTERCIVYLQHLRERVASAHLYQLRDDFLALVGRFCLELFHHS